MVGVDGSVARVVVTPFEHYCNRPEEVPSQKGNASAPAGNAQIPENIGMQATNTNTVQLVYSKVQKQTL